MSQNMQERIAHGHGFIAALDQSGGSTPAALAAYGVPPDAYSDDAGMFDLVHEMRTRIIASPSFTSERILGAILFEATMDRDIHGVPTAAYLWGTKGVVPFLKIDDGLAEAADGVRLMKPIPGLADLLARANSHGVFGTKERSVILESDGTGIRAIVQQQFEVGHRVLEAGLCPILEPEVDIRCPDKADAEKRLRDEIRAQLDQLPSGTQIMLKLTLPTEDGFYADLVAHRSVLRVVALSGGYSREQANALLARNPGLIASFSRALVEDLSFGQTPAEFDAALASAVTSIYEASLT